MLCCTRRILHRCRRKHRHDDAARCISRRRKSIGWLIWRQLSLLR
jgi:hypothetical protein